MDEESHEVGSFEQETAGMGSQDAQTPSSEPESLAAATGAAEKPRRLRRFLAWTVGLLVLFAFGVVAAWFLQIRPMREQNRMLQIELSAAEQSVEELSAEVERLRPLEPENENLKSQVARLESHIFLLDVLVDVSKAQLAMAEEDPIAAGVALDGTGNRLRQLENRLGDEDAQTVQGLGDRLVLVLQEVESDAFAARRDLEILANNLLDLEQRLFGG
jgi:predicted outer membrane lipoprotein